MSLQRTLATVVAASLCAALAVGRLPGETLAEATVLPTASERYDGGLEQLRDIPKRIVLDVGRCVRVNGVRMHCGGAKPATRRLRARVVLHVEAFSVAPA